MEDQTNTPNELLDLVNEGDEIIGEVTKGEANSNTNLIHREVAIIIYNKKGDVLVQQRSRKKKVHPGMWAVSCAGHVPRGMSPLNAAHMELKEELGFDAELAFIEKCLDKIPTETRIVYWYVGKYDGEDIVIEREEVERVKWISQNKFRAFADKRKVGKTSKEMINRFWKEKWN